MNINTRNMAFVNFNGEEMQWVKFNGVTVYEAWKILTKNGVPSLKIYSKGEPLINYKITGITTQNGTPTVDNPIPILKVGERTNNLIKYPYFETSKEQNGMIFTDNGDGSITINGTATANTTFNITNNARTIWERVKPNKTYTGKFNYTGDFDGNTNITFNYYRPTSTNYAGWFNVTAGNQKTAVSPADIINLRVYIYIYSGTTFDNFTVYPQLEEGDSVGEWEPYGYRIPIKVNDEITNIYLTEPLNKFGEYEDYIDFENQKVVKNTKTVEMVFSATYYPYASAGSNFYGFAYYDTDMLSGTRIDGYCSYLQKGFSDLWFGVGGNSRIYFNLPDVYNSADNDDDRKENFKQWLLSLEEPFEIVFPRKMEEIPLNLPTINTIKGVNTIDVDTTTKPSDVEVVYKGKEVK